MKKIATVTLGLLALVAFPLSAQSIYVGAGGSFPNSDYGDYAKTGVLLVGGVDFEVAQNLSVWGEGFWGQNKHEGDDSKTNPVGFMAGLMYGFGGEEASVEPYVFAGAGWMIHKYSSDTFGDDSQGAFGLQGGAGLGFDLGGLDAFVEGRYMRASYDSESPGAGSAVTAFMALIAGVSFDLGGDDD
jgi:hypothetical protein